MTTEPQNEKQSARFLAASLLAPIAQTAPANNWPVVLIIAAVCLAASWCLSRYGTPPGKFLTVLQSLWTCVVAAMVLRWSDAYWPGHAQSWAAPLILLLLAAWASASKERAARVGNVLLWPILFLLGAVLISGVPEIEWGALSPNWQMTSAEIISILLLPALTRGSGKGGTMLGLLFFALMASVVTIGVLSYPIGASAKAPVYELSRDLALFGTAQRFESLAASAMTLGLFAALSFLLTASNIEGKERQGIWTKTILTSLLFLIPKAIDSRITALGSLVFFIILPALRSLKNNFQKMEKSA